MARNRRGAMRSAREFFSGVFSFSRSDYLDDGDDGSGVSSIRRSSRTMDQYWSHYRDNPLVRASVVEVVHSLIGIPLIAEYYDTTKQTWLPLPPADRLQKLLRRPSRTIPGAVFWGRQFTEQSVTGNMYLFKRRDNSGAPVEFRRMDARHTLPVDSDVGYKLGIPNPLDGELGGYVWDPQKILDPSSGGTMMLPNATPGNLAGDPNTFAFGTVAEKYESQDVVHVPIDLNPDYPLIGLSPIASALKDIDLDYAITDFTTSVMEKGGTVDKALVTKTHVSESMIRRITRRWSRRHTGPRNAGGLTVIDGLDGTLQNMGMSLSSREMGLADLRKQIEARILMAMDVPPIVVGSVVGLENATYSNYGQARLALHEEHTDPALWRFCSVLEHSLAADFNEHKNKLIRIRPDLSRVLALLDWEDKRVRLMLAAVEGSLLTQDEARGRLELSPLLGGNWYKLPLNSLRVTPGQDPSEDVRVSVSDKLSEPPAQAEAAQLKGFAPASRMISLRAALNHSVESAVSELSSYIRSIGVKPDTAERLAYFAISTRNDGPEGEGRNPQAWRILETAHQMALRHIAANIDAA